MIKLVFKKYIDVFQKIYAICNMQLYIFLKSKHFFAFS